MGETRFKDPGAWHVLTMVLYLCQMKIAFDAIPQACLAGQSADPDNILAPYIFRPQHATAGPTNRAGLRPPFSRRRSPVMKFLFEVSGIQIYQRIIAGFLEALRQIGHEVFLLNPGNYSSSGDYLRAMQANGANYCVLTNSLSPLALLEEDRKAHV